MSSLISWEVAAGRVEEPRAIERAARPRGRFRRDGSSFGRGGVSRRRERRPRG